MANIRAIRSHIKSVTSTQQVTKTMKMVAASKLHSVQNQMREIRTFSRAVNGMLRELGQSGAPLDHPLLEPREEIKKVCYVLFVGNRGLCGMYNTEILRYLEGLLEKEERAYDVVVCGRWGKDQILRAGFPVVRFFEDLSDTPTREQAVEIAEYLKKRYLDMEADEIRLVYQSYVTVLQQEPVQRIMLPAVLQTEDEEGASEEYLYDFLYYPDRKTVLEHLCEIYINNDVFAVMLEAKCGEHTARMTAMTSASDSTDSLLQDLQLALNRARQAAITTEISEIVGGANALAKKKDGSRD